MSKRAFMVYMRGRSNWFQFSTLLALFLLALYVEWHIATGQIAAVTGLVILFLMAVAGLSAGLSMRENQVEKTTVRDTHEQIVASLADMATDIYWQTDVKGIVQDAGGRMFDELYNDAADLIGNHYLSVVKIDQNERERMRAALSALKPYSDIQTVLTDKAGNPHYFSLSATPQFDDAGRIKGYFGIGTDVTARVMSARKLKHMAEHDMLTGLANRYRFSDQIKTDLRQSKDEKCLCLLAIDLDGFKNVNDTLGHQAGDALLNLVGKRLRTHIREHDWAARMGGDEFVVVSRGVANEMEACFLAARLSLALAAPYRIGGTEVRATASIGIACSPQHADDADALMKCADAALYQAKADGRNCYRLYETGLIDATAGL